MKKKNKRIISLLASLAMMSAMGATTVSAEDYDPEAWWCRIHKCFDGGNHLHDDDLKADMITKEDILREAAERMLKQRSVTSQPIISLLQ